jgi:hypothetical protein
MLRSPRRIAASNQLAGRPLIDTNVFAQRARDVAPADHAGQSSRSQGVAALDGVVEVTGAAGLGTVIRAELPYGG